jgi:hypothetical protein
MSDTEIVKAITLNTAMAVVFSMMGQKDKAQLFITHSCRLIVANYAACKRWMDERTKQQLIAR